MHQENCRFMRMYYKMRLAVLSFYHRGEEVFHGDKGVKRVMIFLVECCDFFITEVQDLFQQE